MYSIKLRNLLLTLYLLLQLEFLSSQATYSPDYVQLGTGNLYGTTISPLIKQYFYDIFKSPPKFYFGGLTGFLSTSSSIIDFQLNYTLSNTQVKVSIYFSSLMRFSMIDYIYFMTNDSKLYILFDFKSEWRRSTILTFHPMLIGHSFPLG